MARRIGKKWVPGLDGGKGGWVEKKAKEERDYSSFEDEIWAFIVIVWRWWPDKLIDLLRSETADFANLEILQRVMIRLYARYAYVDITGSRGLTKTYSKFLDRMSRNILWPGTQSAYYGPSYKQLAEIGSKTFRQIEKDYPLLASHWTVEAESKDDFRLTTPYRSSFNITAIRGDNIHDVSAEEYAQEEQPPFDYTEYKRVVLPAVRKRHMIKGKPDDNFIEYQRHSITSAGRKQNHAYQTRCQHRAMMARGESAFVLDIPREAVILSNLKPFEYFEGLKTELTPDEWSREVEAGYTGADENPVIRDEILNEACNVKVMEQSHCGDPNVMYIVGYDVSSEDGARNAKCEVVVIKCERQTDFVKKDRYLKTAVYLEGWPPPPSAVIQAQRLKRVWNAFCYKGDDPNSMPTYIAIDGNSYGKAVVEELMKDLNDGLPPLCIKDYAGRIELTLDGALPVIYEVRASGPGGPDPEAEMLRYAETQFEGRNVRLLTLNVHAGVDAYKRKNGIKDDYYDARIAEPYQRTRDLCGQIQNLKRNITGSGANEQRISKSIQRDKWSALKYALRLAHRVETEELKNSVKKSNGWEAMIDEYRNTKQATTFTTSSPARTSRKGGKRF